MERSVRPSFFVKTEFQLSQTTVRRAGVSHDEAPAFLAFSDPFGSGAFPRATVSHVAPWAAFISLSMKGKRPAFRSSRAFLTRSRLLRAIRTLPGFPDGNRIPHGRSSCCSGFFLPPEDARRVSSGHATTSPL